MAWIFYLLFKKNLWFVYFLIKEKLYGTEYY